MTDEVTYLDPGEKITVYGPPLPDPKPSLGIQFHATWDIYWVNGQPTPEFYKQLDTIQASGADMIRVDFGWSTAQPTNVPITPSQYYVNRLDYTLSAAADRGLQVLVTVHQSPEWARPGTGTNVKQSPTNLVAWKASCKSLAQLFGARVAAWEIWNEPNLKEFTGVESSDPNIQADRYVPILRAASEGLREGYPGCKVVLGGPSQSDGTFIDACYYRGAKDLFDVIAWHPYQGNQTKAPESTDLYDKSRVTFAPSILEHMAYWKDETKEVWWTEFGYSVHSNDGIPASTPWKFGVATNEISADYLVRMFELAKRYPQVTRGFVYTANRVSTDPHLAGFSIMNADGTVRPQIKALSDYAGGTL